jgi:4-aminobutyrate aminotransferase
LLIGMPDGNALEREILDLEERLLSPSARIPFLPMVPERGSGCHFEDVRGRRFLDFHAMACILNTGHNHPHVVAAIKQQADQMVHVNSAYATHENVVRLAARLTNLLPGTQPRQVAFGLSGSDANDGALKLVRAATGRTRAIAFHGAYHGNTYGALSLSAVSLNMRRGFGPEVPGIHHIPYPDTYRSGESATDTAGECIAALTTLLETTAPPEEVAAVFIEPIQGDSGILTPPPEYVSELGAICRRHGILLVAEEVQTGIGRTGTFLASEGLGLQPDVVILGKALGSGMPISAIVADAELMSHWGPPGHVFCTAANPICCAAALATLDVLEQEGLAANAKAMGERLTHGLNSLADSYSQIGCVRGRGLMVGADLVEDRVTRKRDRQLASAVLIGCFKRGLFMTFLSESVLRFAPPLTITGDEVDRALTIVDEALAEALAGKISESDLAAVTGW